MPLFPLNCKLQEGRVVAILLMLPPQLVAPVQGMWSMSGPWASQVVLVLKNLPANAEDMRPGFNPGAGRSPVEGHDNLLQYSCLENPLDRGAWWATVHRVTKSWTRVKQLAHTHTRPLIWNSVLYFALNPITFGPSSIPSLVSQVLVAWGVSVQFSGSVMSNSL